MTEELGAVLLEGVGAEKPAEDRHPPEDRDPLLAGALVAGDEPPMTREPPSRRVRLVLLWRLRIVGEPARLVAAVGRASLNCCETPRSTRPFAWTRGLISSCTPVFR